MALITGKNTRCHLPVALPQTFQARLDLMLRTHSRRIAGHWCGNTSTATCTLTICTAFTCVYIVLFVMFIEYSISYSFVLRIF